MTQGQLLVADVGGTKSEIALARIESGRPAISARRVYASQDYPGLEPILERFLGEPEIRAHAGAIAAACFAVAGPVEGGQTSTVTNLGWQVESAALQERFALPRLRLVNDFAAAGLGIALLVPGDVLTLQSGTPLDRYTKVVIGAGTGLGVSLMTWQGERYGVHPSEAGHADFAPLDETQDKLLAYLRRHFGWVSYERVVSGPGLLRIFSFLRDSGAAAPSRQLLEAIKKRADPAEAIAEFAMAKLDPIAVRALDIFIAAYGAFAGNIALGALARGGVYIAGGIAPKIAPRLRDGAFLRAFSGKGRLTSQLLAIPVHVIMNPQVGLYGAIDVAHRLAQR